MKFFGTLLKLLAALAAVAGAVVALAVYGDTVVAWCKKILKFCCPCVCEAGDCCGGDGVECDKEYCCCESASEEAAEAAAEDASAPAEADFQA